MTLSNPPEESRKKAVPAMRVGEGQTAVAQNRILLYRGFFIRQAWSVREVSPAMTRCRMQFGDMAD
jgi:hypothetical protein